MEEIRNNTPEPIAIIGTSCRLPGGANSPSKLWELLKYPVDLLAEIPHSRFNPTAFYHENPEHPGTTNVTKAYLLEDDPLAFDNDFFNISAREAESMDPQQRVILEVVYEAIESAGYSISQLSGSSTGVFVGQMSDDYRDLILRDVDCHSLYAGTGIARSILANRVSYAFDWKGPSINVDTACSSSLVALHQAVQSLRNGECEMAVVAGVNLVFSPELFSFLSSLRMLSPSGRSRMWDASADGYARGEGFAAIVLKPLSKAIGAGDDIETLIRNTGVNQDGHSAGLTVPSAVAQAELMRSTYARCGLNHLREEDRCQYFEAHGTGTLAGDPKEAEGISMTFFPNHDKGACDNQTNGDITEKKLYVGSIKSVIGHTEGTAGLASLLKASKAVQHGLIPPNLHFNHLNPAIQPYYNNLEVPTSLKPWPTLPSGRPRRASVNSFGFGGTNAHVIIESWDNQTIDTAFDSSSPCWGPFVLSANSKTSLEATVVSLSKRLKSQENINLSRLAWTLQTRRTQFAYRISVSATDRAELIEKLDSIIEKKEQTLLATKSIQTPGARILGIFTGQGAQWATMGASLMRHSVAFRRTFEKLDSALRDIPTAPSWSLVDELLRQDDVTRISSAEISQPLCTALQVALIDLLRDCGITFSAVVGHSSGEIAAAYAAGVIEATDAILIAFYRGFHCSRSANEKSGKMMAVSMTPDDAEAFCKQPRFLGKLVVAAKNSNSSITLSGDARAVEEAKEVLDTKSVFARILKTDMAYHSHHMQTIREPYISSLNKANIQPKRACFGGACNWYSSVYGPNKEGLNMTTSIPFEATYWAENLTNPVLFSHAVSSAIQAEKCDIALEIGPHPALRAPAIECIREASGSTLPYQGVLERNRDALDTFSSALGLVWTTINSPISPVDFAGFRKACEGPNWTKQPVYKSLPAYQWDHDRPMLKESSKSKAWRTRNYPIHELLGYPSPSGGNECHWRNVLRLSDLNWLHGHRFQNQVLLPASGYLAMAVNAALQFLAKDQLVQLVELQDVVIHNGITLEEGSPGVDMRFSIRITDEDPENRTAEFSCRCSNADAASPEFNKEVVTGRVLVKLIPDVDDTLPSRVIPILPMTDVTIDRFYSWMGKIGLEYSKPFMLSTIKRRLNSATVTTTRVTTNHYTIHPGTLDTILQGLYAAFSYPGDGRVWTTYLPKSFQRVRFNINNDRQRSCCANSGLVADCYLTEATARTIRGDIDAFCMDNGHAEVQMQGVVLSSLEVPSPSNDRSMFWKTIWKRDLMSAADSLEEPCLPNFHARDDELHEACERIAYFYIKRILNEVSPDEIVSTEWHFQSLMDWAHGCVNRTALPGQYIDRRTHWETDTLESILRIKEQHEGQIDIELINHLGTRLPDILRGLQSPLQVLKTDGMLERLYIEGLGVPEVNNHFVELLDHLAHQYPRMRVLEVGAGTGGSTSVALQHLGSNLEEYTFTDLSPAFFSAAEARFVTYDDILRYKVLNIEKSPADQGFEAHSYDLVIAAHVLHATSSIAQTVRHCRELLRPGGYLILLEQTDSISLRIPFIFSVLPGWWLGHDDGRKHGPALTEAQWDVILRQNDFSGVDYALRDFESDSMHTFSVMMSQASDDRVSALRDPLSLSTDIARIEKLLIVGGRTLAVSKVAAKIQLLLSPFAEEITVINSLTDVPGSGLKYGSAVVCLSDLEEATFKRMDHARVSAMQDLFRQAKYILWATKGSRDSDPYANITVGIGRSVSRELAHLRLKFVDFDEIHYQKKQPEATILSEMLLQMVCLDLPSFDGILWANETEVAVEQGAVLIPRVVSDEDLNNSLNSLRRSITQNMPLASHPVEFSMSDEKIVIKEMRYNTEAVSLSPLNVLSSSMLRFTCLDGDQPFYMSIATGEAQPRVLAISETNGSVATTTDIFPFSDNVDADEMLSFILTVTICESLLSGTAGTVWVHNADNSIAEIIWLVAQRKGVSVFLTTSNASRTVSSGKPIYIHPRATVREVHSLIPQNTRRFVDMGLELSDSLLEIVTSLRGRKVEVRKGIYHASVNETFSLSYSRSSFEEILQHYCSQPELLHDRRYLTPTTVVKADQLHEQPETTVASSIISWVDIQTIPVQMTPATSHPLFDAQKTYFLVGLTGDVGLSLCQWMVDLGARHLAVASRNPNIPSAVLSNLQSTGAVVRVFSLDIANVDNLRDVHQQIVSSMPPIAGVANAALVVRDHPFDAMAFEDLETVFKPKVVGSQNLDNLFFSTPLDFFILFSSIASVVGKPGQSSYNAANLFMSTLAAQRRKRGVAASVMQFGMLLGFGFIHGQAGPTVEARFRQDDLPAISEPEFHEIFAQAILSGRPESGLSPEVTAGLGTEIDTPWRAIPRFGHCRIKSDRRRTENQHQDQEQPLQGILSQLEKAKDIKESLSILKVAIAHRVGLAIGSSGESLDEQVGLITLGLDSLVAVEIRSWLLKILEVDVPVLKFLSGSSLHDICVDVLEKLPDSSKVWDKSSDSDHKEPNGEVNGVSPRQHDELLRAETPSGEAETTHPPNLLHTNGNQVLTVSSELVAPTSPLQPGTTSNQDTKQPGDHREYERIGEMSHAQAQLYFLHEYLQTNAHNVAYSGYFHGKLDITRLQNALRTVGKRHEAIRSAYFMDNATARPIQAVLPESRIILSHRTSNNNNELQDEMDLVKRFKFEIEKGVVMKVIVISHSPILHSILFIHHHIALDGIGWSVFIADLAKAYSGRLHDLQPSSGIQQAIDMAKRQLEMLKSQSVHSDLAFWKNIYTTVPEPLPLFSFAKLKTRPTVKDYSINTSDVKLSRDVTKLIEHAASRIGVTPFHFYLASLTAFLARCLGISDVAIGIVDANRTEGGDLGTIGYFLNMLPARIQFDHSEQFDAVARRSRDAALGALTHSRAPIDMVIGELGLSRSASHHPLFQVAINYRKAPLNETKFGSDGKIEWDGAVPGGNPYDLFLNVASTSEWTYVSLITQQSLYDSSDCALLLKWYTRALQALAQDPFSQIGKCPISNEVDIMEATELGRGDDVRVPWKGTLVDRVDEIAADLPEEFAIKDDQGQVLTYAQLTARTLEVARRIQEASPRLTSGSHVAVLVDPVADAVSCILAVLRLGFVWIPLDTRNHQQRLRAVVEESRPKVLVCHNATLQLAQHIVADIESIRIFNIDEMGINGTQCEDGDKKMALLSQIKVASKIRSTQPAMILYTSGSTGVPKGVTLTHDGLTNQIYGTTTTLQLGRETTLQQSPLGFDLMLDQIFLALCNGGTIVMVGKTGRGDPTHMAELMVRHGVTLTHFVPSEYLALLNYGQHILKGGRSWRYAMSGGEKLGWELRRAFRKLNCSGLKLVNVYGPAEITLACARGIVPYHELSDDQDSYSDYLRPSPNYGLEIMDANMNILPVGFPGEICISGQGVGLGYLGRPDESEKKFLYRESITSPSAFSRIYRSGDEGRLLPDGTLKVLGRLDGDSQVKIHGFRVELDEIANAIVHMSNGAVVNAAVSWRPSHLSGTLVAFVVFENTFTQDKSDFVKWLRTNLPLPPIMKPRFIVPIERIPATPNGKIDRVAVDQLPIPEPAGVKTNGHLKNGFTPWEQSMKEVWEEALSTQTTLTSNGNDTTIQPTSDFFEIGGNSILMIKLKTLLQVQFGITVSMPELFHSSTLGDMATLLENSTLRIKETTRASTMDSFLKPGGTQQIINWDLEIASMIDGLPQPSPRSSISNPKLLNGKGGLTIVLTGATGFIGRHLLSRLVQDPRVARVHCLSIRPDDSGKPRHIPLTSDKIIEHVGDLSTLSLGLLDSEFASLAENAHAIIHNGADVSLLKTYRSLRRANVLSTRKLCEMAIPRRIPVHYMSTASVAKVIEQNSEEHLLEVAPWPAVPELLNSVDGYAATKWVSEMLLDRVAIGNELPAYVHRLAHVVGDDASELDAIGMLTKYSLLLRALPRIDPEDIIGQWDFVTVEDITKNIIESVLDSATSCQLGRDSLQNQTHLSPGARFINHCSDVKVPHEELKEYLENLAGESLREVEMGEWLTDAVAKGLNPLVHNFFIAFQQGSGKMVLPIIGRNPGGVE
ncbi:hybrid PKS-NRPS PsoA [Xylaria sp. FL1777]|nr:hybrid PKS-NRPS PsoA [Xylaria sp. FL1777]